MQVTLLEKDYLQEQNEILEEIKKFERKEVELAKARLDLAQARKDLDKLYKERLYKVL